MNNVMLFYENLYKHFDHELDYIYIKSVLSSSSVTCLDAKVSQKLDEHTTEQEVLLVFKDMKTNKSLLLE